jgi:hypothetical protein
MKTFPLAFLLLALVSQTMQSQSHATPSQVFGETDDSGAKPARLTKSILAALLATKEAQAGRSWAHENPGKDPNVLFKAFPLSLSESPEKDYVIWGQAPLTGADNNWFWIVRSGASTPRVVLFCGALTVKVLSTLHNSLEDIQCSWESPGGDGFISHYRFNGQRYVLFKKTETHRRP